MSPKSVLLAAATVGVLGLALYLFIQVRTGPANATAVTQPRPSPQARTPEPPPSPTPPPTTVATTKPVRTNDVVDRKLPQMGTEVDGPPPLATPDESRPNLKLDNLMELANKAYDQQDFDQATAIAGKVLAKEPNNVRMLRIMVSSHCIQGDSAVAQQHYERLPAFDREQMRARCDRYGVAFKEPPN